MNSDGIAAALRRVTTGLYILGVREADGAPYASTVSWVMPLSLEPPMIGVALQPQSKTMSLVRESGAFSLSLVATEREGDAAKLGRASAEVPNKGAGVVLEASSADLPILPQAPAWLECRLVGERRNGDHVLAIAEVVAAWGDDDTSRRAWSYWGC